VKAGHAGGGSHVMARIVTLLLIALLLLPVLPTNYAKANSSTVTIFSEDFEGVFEDGHNGWSLGNDRCYQHQCSEERWGKVTSSFGGEGTHSGNWKAYCAAEGYEGTSSAPTCPPSTRPYMKISVDLSDYSEATLSFWMKIPSLGEGDNTNLRLTYPADELMGFAPCTDWWQFTYDLTPWCGSENYLGFKWYFYANQGGGEGWYIDDILITGKRKQAIGSVEIKSVTINEPSYPPCYPFQLTTWFENTGDVLTHLRAVAQIEDPYGDIIYDSRAQGDDVDRWLDRGDSSFAEFSWEIPQDAKLGTYRTFVSLRDWDNWNILYDEEPGPTFQVYADQPLVETDEASGMSETSATLNGNLVSTGDLDCKVWFEYGTSADYGSSTWKVTKRVASSFSNAITGLSPGTTYHFRACASNGREPVHGEGKTFTTEGGTVTYPDLIITSVSWSPISVEEGNGVTFYYTEYNQGDEDSGDFGTALYIDGDRIDISARHSLGAGQSRARQFTYVWEATPGCHGITVQADWGNTVDEGSREDNNSLTKTLCVDPSEVDGEIIDIRFASSYTQGDIVEVYVDVRNPTSTQWHYLVAVEIHDPHGNKVYDSHPRGEDKDRYVSGGSSPTFGPYRYDLPKDAPTGTYHVLAGLRQYPWEPELAYRGESWCPPEETFTVDKKGDITAPTTPGTPYMYPSSDSGKSSNDRITNDATPTFGWSASSDPESGITGYAVSYTDSTPDDDDYWTTSNSWTPGSDILEGSHNLYVCAKNNAGLWSGVSQVSFTIDRTPPAPPTFVSPGEWEEIEDTTPTLDWNNISGAWKYQAWVREHDLPWLDSCTSPELTSSQWTVSRSLGYKAWGWQVRVWDVAGNLGPYGRDGVTDSWGHFSVVEETDITSPTNPGTPYMYPSSDSGKSSNDRITNDATPTFGWSASSDPESGITGYAVSYTDSTPDDDDYWMTTNSWAPGSDIPEGSHNLYVCAKNNVGLWSGVSQVSFTIDRTPPAPPTFASPGEWEVIEDTTPTLDWNNISGAWKYQAWVREHDLPWLDSCTSPELTSSQWTVSRALGYKDWGWQVKAWDIAGNEGSYGRDGVTDSWGHFTIESGTPNPPQAPINLSANTVSAFQIDLNWDDMSDNEDGFRVERKQGSGGTWSKIDTVEANTESYSDSGLECDTWYYYRVQAYNSEGESAYSNEAGSKTHEPDLPDLRVVNLSWSPDTVNEGDRVTFSCTVENSGIADATDFGCRLLLDGEGFDLSVRTSLAPGESRVLEFTHVWTASPGGHSVAIVADWAENIAESDETNNETTRSLGIYKLEIESIQIRNENNIEGAVVAGSYQNSIEVQLRDNLGSPVVGATVVADWDWPDAKNITFVEHGDGLYIVEQFYMPEALTRYSLEIRAEKNGYEPAAKSLDVPSVAPSWSSIEPVEGWLVRLDVQYPIAMKVGNSYYFAYPALCRRLGELQLTYLILDENGQLVDQTVHEHAAKAAAMSGLAQDNGEAQSLRSIAGHMDAAALALSWAGVVAELRDFFAKLLGILLTKGTGFVAAAGTEVTGEIVEEGAEKVLQGVSTGALEEILDALGEEMFGEAAKALVGGLQGYVRSGLEESADAARDFATALEDYHGVMDYETAETIYKNYKSLHVDIYLYCELAWLLEDQFSLEGQLKSVMANIAAGATGIPFNAVDDLTEVLLKVDPIKQVFISTAAYNSQRSVYWEARWTTLAKDIRSDFSLYEDIQITDVSSFIPLAKAMDSGQIAAQVSVQSEVEGQESKAQIVDMTYDPNVSVATDVDADRVTVTVTSEAPVGKTIVVNIDASILGISEIGDIVVLYDEHRLNMAADYEDVLNTSDNEAEYLVIAGGHGVQVLISIPHFSTHTIVITRATQESSMLLAIGIGLGVIGILTLLFLIFHRRRGARRSKAS